MGRRIGQKQPPQTLISPHEGCQNVEQHKEEEEAKESGAGFFACYLLTSLCPRFKGHTYIGYTVNPRRRIRQHNGEIGSGAWRTKRKRPWEMVLCIYGFPTNISALQFEWAWQHPIESLAVRKAAASFKSLSGLANKIKMAYTMLTLPPWQSLNLTVNLFSTKYQKYTSGCPTLPKQMRTQVCLMDELPCYNMMSMCADDEQDYYDDEEGHDINCTFQGSAELKSIEATAEVSQKTQGHFEENVIQQKDDDACGRPGNSPPIEEDQAMNGSPRLPFPFNIVDNREQSPTLVKEVASETDQKLTTESATICVAEGGGRMSMESRGIANHEVEIIELFTPSPCSKINSCSKRRPTQCPEIIDLTNSPIFV